MSKRKVVSLTVSVALLAAVIISVCAVSGTDALLAALWQLAPSSVAAIVLLLTAGLLLSALRLKLITGDLGYSLSMRDATATLSVGQLAGSVFFQLAGQLIGRGAMLARRGIPPAASVVISGYERIFALFVSLILAACGATYLFGKLSFDLQTGGLALLRLALGLAAVAAAGAALAWGHYAVAMLRRLTPALALRLLRSSIISLTIQLTTLAAYVVAGHALAPHIGFGSLAAAATVIMFAASLPISLGGWGLREMSAVVALQAVGLPSASALLLALLIGVLSIAVVGAAAMVLTIGGGERATRRATVSAAALDYTLLLDWMIPIAAASAVFFQIYLPTGHGNLNVNLADPLVLVGAALFALRQIGKGPPAWRLPHLNLYVAAGSAVIACSFVHGLAVFGWTEWAFANRLIGWVMLLCYGATGALIVRRAGEQGLDVLLLSLAAAGAAIAALDVGLTALAKVGLPSLSALVEYPISGFSQNRNAFTFILLMSLASALTLQDRLRGRTALMAIILAAIVLAGSRAGMLAVPVIVGLAFVSGLKPRPILAAFAGAAAIVLGLWSLGSAPREALLDDFSDSQHLLTVQQGIAMFLAHPLFGAGLGAYMAGQLETTGVPLIIHSTGVWLLAETGLAGFAVFALAAWRIFACAYRRRFEPAGLALLLALGGFAVMAQAHDLLYQRALWLLLGAALAWPEPAAAAEKSR